MPSYKKINGFSLIELMIVIAVIAIIASIALPSYQDSVRKANRRDAQAHMTEFAQFLERNYSEAFLYNQDSGGGGIDATSYPPPTSVSNNYTVVLAPSSTSFTITATPKGSQTKDSCGTMTLNETGANTPATNCW